MLALPCSKTFRYEEFLLHIALEEKRSSKRFEKVALRIWEGMSSHLMAGYSPACTLSNSFTVSLFLSIHYKKPGLNCHILASLPTICDLRKPHCLYSVKSLCLWGEKGNCLNNLYNCNTTAESLN